MILWLVSDASFVISLSLFFFNQLLFSLVLFPELGLDLAKVHAQRFWGKNESGQYQDHIHYQYYLLRSIYFQPSCNHH